MHSFQLLCLRKNKYISKAFPAMNFHLVNACALRRPELQRVYPSCIYPVACLIIVMYVDNNGVRHNCNELLEQFEADVAADGRIDLHREGDMSSFLSVLYLNNTETGEITADQEAYIDGLLAQYNMTDCNSNKVPIKPSVNLDEIAARLPKTSHPVIPSLYAKLIDELMFVAINTFNCSPLTR